MRYTILMSVLLATCSVGMAQKHTGDQKAIEAQIGAFVYSW